MKNIPPKPLMNIRVHRRAGSAQHASLLSPDLWQSQMRETTPLCVMKINENPPRIQFQLWLQKGIAALLIHEV